jgi:general secretion pathway protein D
MKSKISRGFVFCLLGVGLWLFALHNVTEGARVTGEEGVTPAVRDDGEKARPAPVVRHPPELPSPKRPVPAKEKRAEKKAVAEVKKAPKAQESDSRYVTIDFDNVDIAIFIKFISELTGKNFVIDKGVKGKVTIISPTKITVDEAYKVFESVLEVHGFTAVPAGKIIKIVPAVEARAKDVETRLRIKGIVPEDKVVTQLIPLKYADPGELKKLFAPLISKSSVIVAYPPTGMLIVTDVLSNIARLLRIIETIDVEGIGEEISVVPLKYATASVMAKSLSMLFQKTARRVKKGVPEVPVIKIAPDERTNVLIILASEDDTLKIKQLIKLLDKETPRGEGDIRVYYLQNANAEDLAKVLMAIPSEQPKDAKKGTAPVISKGVQVVADAATNSLVITASKDDYLVLEDVIEKLDISRRMVYIEALIMEVSVTKGFDLGVEWRGMDGIGSYEGRKLGVFGGSSLGESVFPTVDATGLASLPVGFSLGLLGEGITIGGATFPNIGAVIRAYQKDSDVHILSTPQIMTTDNEEAEIQVGKNVPYLTRQDTSQTGIDYSNYEYKDVGVTLKITPQINQERFVRLKISHELSQVVEEESTTGLPTTLKRLAKTTVIIKDGNTVVIGGLIDETISEATYRVPCLGNMPAMGWLFRAASKDDDKTNLFVFLTPHIIENPSEAKTVYDQKKGQIDKIREGVIKMYERNRHTSPKTEGR